jgi:hypothetical protein
VGETAVDTAVDVGETAVDTAVDVGEAVVDTAADVGEAVVDTAVDVGEAVVDTAADVGEAVVDTVVDAGESAMDGISTAVNDIQSSFTNAMGGGGAATTVAIYSMMARFVASMSPSNVADTVTDAVDDLGEAAGAAVDAAGDMVGDAVSGAVDTVVDTAHDVSDAAADLGRSAADVAHDVGDAAVAGGQAVADGVGAAADAWNNMDPNHREGIHLALDIAGFVPVIGEVADVANGVLYLAEGDYVNAGISFVSAIPLAGDTAKGGRAVTKGAKFADSAVSAYKAFEVASTAWTAADLSVRAFNVGSTGKLSAGAKGLSLAPAMSALQGGASYLSKASAAPTGRLLDLFG